MADQRIHLFKVFRGSSVAKANKYLSCSFISKSTSANPLPNNLTDEARNGNRQGTKSEQSQSHTHPHSDIQMTVGVTESELTRNTGKSFAMKQQSLRFIYHQQDSSEQNGSQNADPIQQMKIEESSIDIEQQSEWIDLQKINPVIGRPVGQPTRILSLQRKIIQEEKLKLQAQKRELQSKRIEIEALINEFNKLKSSCERTELSKSPRALVSQFEDIRCINRLNKRKVLSTRYAVQEEESHFDPKTKQEKLQKSITQMHKSQQLAKKQKARQAILLETLLINLIKNNNEIRNKNSLFMKQAFCKMKNIYRTNKFKVLIGSSTYVLNLMAMGQAFVRIKKVDRNSEIISRSRKFVGSKFAQYSRKENICPIDSDRVYEESSRLFRFGQSNQKGLTESLDFEFLKNKGSANRVNEIDTIIKNQMDRTRQIRTQRGRSIEDYPDTMYKETLHRTTRFQAVTQRGQKKQHHNNHLLKPSVAYNTLSSSSGRIHFKQINSVLKPESTNKRVIPR